MGKVGKLTKLKSAIKRLHSMSKLGRTNSSSTIVAVDTDFSEEFDSSSEKLLPVYVGKSRRRYLLSADIIDHPLFQELVDRSSSSSSSSSSSACTEGGVTSVACEVVLFEHLLWMLENSESSMDELVEFYSN